MRFFRVKFQTRRAPKNVATMAALTNKHAFDLKESERKLPIDHD